MEAWQYGSPYRKIDIGEEFYIANYSRLAERTGRHADPFAGDTWQGPFEVTRVTETQFTVGSTRFMRTTGYEVGGGGYRGLKAERATEDYIANVIEMRAAQLIKRKAEIAKSDAKETALRDRYGALHIDDEECQKVLQKLRMHADLGRGQMQAFLKIAQDAKVKQPYGLSRAIGYGEHQNYLRGLVFYDNARELHQRLVNLYEGFIANSKIKVRLDEDEWCLQCNDGKSDAVGVLKTAITVARRKAETEFFGYHYDDDDAELKAEWVKTLRDIDGIDNDYPSIRVTDDDDEG